MSTIFDLLDSVPSSEKLTVTQPSDIKNADAFFEFAQKETPIISDGAKELSRPASLLGAAAKGTLKGIPGLVKLGHPEEAILAALGKSSPIESLTQVLTKKIPSREALPEKLVEKTFEIAPSASIGGGGFLSTAIKSAIGAGLSVGAKKLDLPEWIQAAGEIAPMVGPSLAKKLVPTKAQKPFIDFMRRMGMSEKEMTPLLQGETKQKILSKIAPKRGRTQDALLGTKKALGDIYETLKTAPEAQIPLDTDSTNIFRQKLGELFKDLPSTTTKHIEQDIDKLFSEPITGKSLMRFNAAINDAASKEGAYGLTLMKKPLVETMAEISKPLTEDFTITNSLWGKYATIQARLKPTLASDLWSISEGLRLLGGVTFGNFPVLIEVAGEHAGKAIAREMLINPRMQNLSMQFVKALNSGKYAIANSIIKRFGAEIQDIDPDTAKLLSDLKIDERSFRK